MKRNAHKSFGTINARRARAEAAVLTKAGKHYARAAQLQQQGKPLQARTEAVKGKKLAQRAYAAGKHIDGPVGRLPNPRKRNTSVAGLRSELDQVDRDIAELETDPFYKETPGRRAFARKWLAHHRRQRREIERLLKQRKNGIVEAAAGLQALEYLGGKVKTKRNPAGTSVASGRYPQQVLHKSLNTRVRKAEVSKTISSARARQLYGLIDKGWPSYSNNSSEQRSARIRAKREIDAALRRQNPSITTLSKTFQGEADGVIQEDYAASAAPKNLARAGKLVFLKVAGRSLRIPGATVAIAPNGKLWITADHAPLFDTKAKAGEELDAGEVSHICYETAKTHIGNGKRYEYVHEFGEDGGRRPHLIIDHEGMPILRGGDYTIKAEGIVN